jgi:glycosyltransferase involved in cell wall biosynthesis
MKIGIMLRHLGQHRGGVLVYTHNLLREMLTLDTPHEFVLLYQKPSWLGSYNNGSGGRVRELALGKAPSFMWDQWLVPQAEKKEKFDLIFNPKYSLPLLSKSRTVFVCHGLDWYVIPGWSKLMDRLNHRYLIPRYAKKADAIIAVSNTVREQLIEYLRVEEERVHTVYLGVDEAFGEPIPPERLEEVRSTYGLPERFFLYCGQIYPPRILAG